MDLLSEEETWEGLKRWVRTNALQVIVMVALVLAGWYGWKWWQTRTDTQALAANDLYDRALTSFDAQKNDEAVALIETLRTDHPKSAYVAAADLAAARVFVARNELDKAVQRLERVSKEAVDVELRPIANLRLARVYSAQAQYDKALAVLGTEDKGVYQSAYLETRGDVLLAKGDRAGALAAYVGSRKLVPAAEGGAGGVGELLDLKIADLQAPVASTQETKP